MDRLEKTEDELILMQMRVGAAGAGRDRQVNTSAGR